LELFGTISAILEVPTDRTGIQTRKFPLREEETRWLCLFTHACSIPPTQQT